MADARSYLDLYPKSFLRAFGLLPERRVRTKRKKRVPSKRQRVPRRDTCKYGHPWALYRRVDSEGKVRCRKCLTLANRRYEARRKRG